MTLPRGGEGAESGFAVGWSGKLPSNGDFVSRRVPAAFSEPWERWLAAVLAGSREALRERWREAFLQAPAWRFVLAGGVLGADGWAGLLLPSVDSVGRYYPLTLVCALPAKALDPAATLLAARAWFGEIETIALDALAPSADIDALDAALTSIRFPSSSIAPAPASGAGAKPSCAWLAEDSEIFAGRMLLSEGLPSIAQYCEMLTGEPAGRERKSA